MSTLDRIEPTFSALQGPEALREKDRAKARQIVRDGTPTSTTRARDNARRYFWRWAHCALDLVESYPVDVDVVIRFITDHTGEMEDAVDRQLVAEGTKAKLGPHSVATIEARLAHLSKMHRSQGHESPTRAEPVRELLLRLRRARARNGGQRAKAPLTLEMLERLLATCRDHEKTGLRDRAILLVGFGAGGRRRSEIAALKVEDLRRVGDEYLWTLRHSKTDQEGLGLEVAITGRAAAALDAWLEHAGIEAGAVFPINGQSIGRMIQRRAKLAGLDPAVFGGHSLRAGFMTEAGQRGVPLAAAMEVSGHQSPATALRYHRSAALTNVAARLLG